MSVVDKIKERMADRYSDPFGEAVANGHSESQAFAAARTELARRHEIASRRFAELQWDLGGLAYEMAIRDHFRLDVLQRAAAAVQEADAELSNLSRLLELEQAGAAGSCPNCGVFHARGAAFCSSCGQALIEDVRLG